MNSASTPRCGPVAGLVWSGVLYAGVLGLVCAAAQDRPAPKSVTSTSAPARAELTVAVLDFAADSPGQPALGAQISEALTALLSGEPGFRLVDRAALARTLQEHELNLSGVVATEQAVQVGKLIGARILVAGKAFTLGKQMFITAKIIGTETSLVEGVLVRGAADADTSALVSELAEKLATRLRESGPKLVAQPDAVLDPLPGLKTRLTPLAKPIVAVVIPERHVAREVAPARDPAVETEVKRLLSDCGFTIKDVKANALADFARTYADPAAWPRELAGVDIVVTGEGFSEFAARIGNLVSCAARAEVNVINRADGKIVLATRTTQRGVDLSENIAAKKGLQNAGRVIGIDILTYFAETLSAPDATRPK